MTYLEQKLSMAITDGRCSAAVQCKALNCLLKVVKLLSKIQGANKHLVPAATLKFVLADSTVDLQLNYYFVRERSQTL
jgi:hypothetical protein